MSNVKRAAAKAPGKVGNLWVTLSQRKLADSPANTLGGQMKKISRKRGSARSKKSEAKPKAKPPEPGLQETSEFEEHLPESTKKALEEMKEKGGRVPKMPDKAVPPAIQDIGRRLRHTSLDLVEIKEVGRVSRCYCRSLVHPKELMERVQILLQVFDCRVYREYLWRDEDFLSAYVVEFQTSKKSALFSALEVVAGQTYKPVESVRLPTNNPDRNRPQSSWNPLMSKGQEGVHVNLSGLAPGRKPQG